MPAVNRQPGDHRGDSQSSNITDACDQLTDVGTHIYAYEHALVLADKSLMFVEDLFFPVDHPLMLVKGCGLSNQ